MRGREFTAVQPAARLDAHAQHLVQQVLRRLLEQRLERELCGHVRGRRAERHRQAPPQEDPRLLGDRGLLQRGEVDGACGERPVLRRVHVHQRVLQREQPRRAVEDDGVVLAPEGLLLLPDRARAHQRVAHGHLHVGVDGVARVVARSGARGRRAARRAAAAAGVGLVVGQAPLRDAQVQRAVEVGAVLRQRARRLHAGVDQSEVREGLSS